MQALVSRSRRPKFDLVLRIIDLNNVPLVSGTSFIKWHLPHSTAAEHRGRTSKCHIRDHKVCYEYEKVVPVRLTVDKHGMLQESIIHFEVLQEYASGAKGERIQLGHIKLNLAEYVGGPYDDEADEEEGICRRYLMQDSKINSTLKVCIRMRLVEGDRNFTAPPLKTAPVFVGIAGIMAGEQGNSDDIGHLSTLNSKTRENGEIQDMYRRNLAASWSAQPGELRADECVEDIFSGGDGWGTKAHRHEQSRRKYFFTNTGDGDNEDREGSSSDTRPNSSGRGGGGGGGSHESRDSKSTIRGAPKTSHHHETHSDVTSGPSSLAQHTSSMKAEGAVAVQNRDNHEVDEFAVRENLRSWKLPETQAAS